MQELADLDFSVGRVEFGAVVEIKVLEALAKESIVQNFLEYNYCDFLCLEEVF